LQCKIALTGESPQGQECKASFFMTIRREWCRLLAYMEKAFCLRLSVSLLQNWTLWKYANSVLYEHQATIRCQQYVYTQTLLYSIGDVIVVYTKTAWSLWRCSSFQYSTEQVQAQKKCEARVTTIGFTLFRTWKSLPCIFLKNVLLEPMDYIHHQ